METLLADWHEEERERCFESFWTWFSWILRYEYDVGLVAAAMSGMLTDKGSNGQKVFDCREFEGFWYRFINETCGKG